MTLHQSMLDSLNHTGDSHSDMDQSLSVESPKYVCLVHVYVHMYGLQIAILGFSNSNYGAT